MYPDFSPKKSLGQNFLFDRNILNKIVSSLGLNNDDRVLEIGAGLGTLTSLLIEKAHKIIALEIDKRAVVLLNAKFKNNANVEIIEQDFLKYDIKQKFFKKKLKVVGNIPFYITTPIIERLFNFRDRIESIFLTVQKEVAERITALPSTKEYGALTCFVQYYALPRILFNIKAGSFVPAPKVDAAFLKLEILKDPYCEVSNGEQFFRMVRCGFSQRRKTLVNALSPMFKKELSSSVIKELGFNPKIRIENLSMKELAAFFNCLRAIST